MAEAALFVLVLLVGLGAPVVLYLLIEDETRESDEMSRADAEEHARRRSRERYGDGNDRDDRQ
ncbi:hypothetical protein [Salinigranum salinum]|uniref:hypothetical protein n=1 Tax=Salinigranum salinum TaxID=1364937 RepID=UPI001260D40F|nr:hypothetical protein [Salinigranum salinum]